jgi:hypothetical protein
LFTSLVLVDATLDVASSQSGYPTVAAARLLSLEGGLQLLQLLAVLFELGLEVLELLELCSLVPLGGRHCSLISRVLSEQSLLGWSVITSPHGGVTPLCYLDLDVKAFTGRVVAALVGVRVAEAVVSRGQEPT